MLAAARRMAFPKSATHGALTFELLAACSVQAQPNFRPPDSFPQLRS